MTSQEVRNFSPVSTVTALEFLGCSARPPHRTLHDQCLWHVWAKHLKHSPFATLEEGFVAVLGFLFLSRCKMLPALRVIEGRFVPIMPAEYY